MAKIFAIYGSSGAYKTTTALALANHISKTQPKANIIVVGTDVTKPIIPIVAPNNKEFTGSLGRCLSDVSFEETDLRRKRHEPDIPYLPPHTQVLPRVSTAVLVRSAFRRIRQ